MIIAHLVNRLVTQMRYHKFDAVELVAVISFLPAFQLPCVDNGMLEGTAMC